MANGVVENENIQIAEDWLEFLVAREACSGNSSEAASTFELQMKLQDLGKKLDSLARKQVQFRSSVERLGKSPAALPQYLDDFAASPIPSAPFPDIESRQKSKSVQTLQKERDARREAGAKGQSSNKNYVAQFLSRNC